MRIDISLRNRLFAVQSKEPHCYRLRNCELGSEAGEPVS